MKNKLLCEDGVCRIPSHSEMKELQKSAYYNTPKSEKPVQITYFTDPICSSCWGIEPQLRRLKMEYGKYVHIEYKMGGLLKDWNYSSATINKPSDVAVHWDEVSPYYQMPIDGDIWLEDPLDSSYPPSIAFKAAQLQDEKKAYFFLRELREMVFLRKKNITKEIHLVEAAKKAELDIEKFKADFKTIAKDKFQEDLKLTRESGVRGFPTLILNDKGQAKQEVIGGFKPYTAFVAAIKAIYPDAKAEKYDTSWEYLFNYYPTLATKEFAILTNQTTEESKALLEDLYKQKKLTQIACKNGVVWTKAKNN